MSFLRRRFGGGGEGGASAPRRDEPVNPAAADLEDAERNRQLLADEARRVSDDLVARQLRYADRSWTPPAQGGPRRADDDTDERGDRG